MRLSACLELNYAKKFILHLILCELNDWYNHSKSICVVTLAPLLFHTLFGKRGYFHPSPLLWGHLSFSFSLLCCFSYLMNF